MLRGQIYARKFCLIVVILLGAILLAVQPTLSKDLLKLATTTSVENTGLLYELTGAFKDKTGIDTHVIAVGTGKALKLGEMGDVDAVLVHSRKAEDAFIKAGHGLNRKDVMYNDFVIIGSEKDPAQIKKLHSVLKAFRQIKDRKATFVSRGDDSGTHKKELSIWKQAETVPEGSWYKEAGLGMAQTILMADNMDAYTLTDRGTYLKLNDKIHLVICFENDPPLMNYYGVIAVNPAKHKDANYKAAMAFINFITSDEGQKIIAEFKYKGQQLFYPNAK